MAKPNNKTQKSFSISAIIGAMLMASHNGNPKLSALKIQIDKSMRVFSSKAPMKYYAISSEVQKIWADMAKQHNNTLTDDEVTVFIEMVASLIPRQDFKTFLGINPYTTTEKLRDCKKSSLLMTVLSLDKKLNDMFGTQATANRESLGKILTKQPKVKRVKSINRDIAVSKRTKRLRNAIQYRKAKNREEC